MNFFVGLVEITTRPYEVPYQYQSTKYSSADMCNLLPLMVKAPNLVQMRLISYRSIIELMAF